VTVIDRLYSLEIEFHRLSRSEAINPMEAGAIHTSYALQNGYEPLLKAAGTVGQAELAMAKRRIAGAFDPRDVEAAFSSLRRLIIVE
jgi:hypothetical protein